MALGYVKKMQTEKKLGVASRLLGRSLLKSRETASAREDGERREPSRTAGGCPPVWPLRDTGWRCRQKLRAELSCDPAIPFLGIYSKETPTKPKDSGFGGDSEALCALKRGNTVFKGANSIFTVICVWAQILPLPWPRSGSLVGLLGLVASQFRPLS